MANLLKIKRGTRAQLNAAVTGNTLNLGEPYLITDENRIAVGTGSNSYEVFAKTSEIITVETDTLATVTGRGDTTSTAITLSGGVTINAAGSTNGALFAGSTSGTTKLVATPAASGVITLPASTGTVALTSDIPTVNSGTLGVSIGAAGATNTTVTWGTASGFNANSTGATTYDLNVGPALTALATFMTTATAGFIMRTGQDTYSIDTSTYITGNQTITLTGDVTGSGTTSITTTLANSGVAAGTYTKITVDAKGRATAGTTLIASDIPTLTATKISDFNTQVRTSSVAQLAAPVAPLAMNSQKITGLADPTSAQDATTKAYVDSIAQGLDIKSSVRAATTANITLYGMPTIDGVSLAVGDRVLVKNQTTPSQNGIYVATGGSWTRGIGTNTWAELVSAFVFVEEGTTYADTGWVSTVNAAGTLGTTAVEFTQFSGAGAYIAGTGMVASGNTFNVQGTINRISVSADNVDIDANYVGQTSITTLGTITTGTWSATAIGVTKGGTGLTAAVTGLLKGDGSAYAAAVAGTDYLDPASTIDGGTF